MNKKIDLPFYYPGEAYEFSKTLKHFLYGLVLTLLASAITWIIGYIELLEIPAEYTYVVGFIIALLLGLSNLVKHWKDEYDELPIP